MKSSLLPNAMFVLVTVLLFAFSAVEARRFRAHDSVGIVANTIGPFNNPTETYPVNMLMLNENCTSSLLKSNILFVFVVVLFVAVLFRHR